MPGDGESNLMGMWEHLTAEGPRALAGTEAAWGTCKLSSGFLLPRGHHALGHLLLFAGQVFSALFFN